MTSAQARRALLPYLPRIRSLRAAKTLLALLLHSNARGESWPSGAALARATGLPVRSVWAGLRELEALDLVARVSRGHGRANLYRILPSGSPPMVTHKAQGGDSRITGLVTPESPPPIVTGGSLSERPKPRHTWVPAQEGARRGSDPRVAQKKEQKKNRVIEQQASASGPPAFNRASGPEASGLDEPEALFEQLLEEVLNRVPFDPNLGGWMIGTHDLIRVRKYIEDKFPELLEVFRRVARSRMGDRGFDEAWQAAVTNGVGSCAAWHSGDRRWRRIYLFVGETLGLFNAVVEACYALFSPSDGGGPRSLSRKWVR